MLLRKAHKTTRIESCSRRRVVVDEPKKIATKDWDIHAYPAILNEYVFRYIFRYLINQWRNGAPVELSKVVLQPNLAMETASLIVRLDYWVCHQFAPSNCHNVAVNISKSSIQNSPK
jgi:hypothetical protein